MLNLILVMGMKFASSVTALLTLTNHLKCMTCLVCAPYVTKQPMHFSFKLFGLIKALIKH